MIKHRVICVGKTLTITWRLVSTMGKNVINCPRFTVVLTVLLFLLSGVPNVSSQQNPYAPEIDYSCIDISGGNPNGSGLEVEYEDDYGYVKCTISNNNPHDVTVKISEEWEHNVDGLYEERTDSSYYCGGDSKEIGREINVQASSTIIFCVKISADKYAAEGISILTSTAEVVRYSAIIPCDVCEPVDEEVQVEILPWHTIIPDFSATPESAYSYNHDESERIICDKSDFSELLLEVTVDGNFLGKKNFSVDFSYQIIIRDLSLDDYVEYSESTFGEVNLEFDPEPLTFEAGETVRRVFKASWDIKEDTDNYDIQLSTIVKVYGKNGNGKGNLIDFCPLWEGDLSTQEINLNNEPSEGTFNLSSSFSMPLSVISMMVIAVLIRKEKQAENVLIYADGMGLDSQSE
jgi:hypothetical protein